MTAKPFADWRTILRRYLRANRAATQTTMTMYVVREDHETTNDNGKVAFKKGEIVEALPSHPDIKPEGWTLVQNGENNTLLPSRILVKVSEASTAQETFVLAGFYYWLFVQVEPLLSMATAGVILLGDPAKFYHSLLPSSDPAPVLDQRGRIVMSHLASCFLVLGLLPTIVFPTVQKALRFDPVNQERIIGASLTALAIGDVIHATISWAMLPQELIFRPSAWSAVTHGNITFIWFLFLSRVSWFLGIGRARHWYGTKAKTD